MQLPLRKSRYFSFLTFFFLSSFWMLFPAVPARAMLQDPYTVQSLPNPKTNGQGIYVSDPDHILSADSKAQLNLLSQRLDTLAAVEFSIVIVNDYVGDSDFQFALDLFNHWGIGKKGADNGLLLFVAVSRHEYRFITGYGMEAVLPDAYLKRIGEKYLVPNFQAGNYEVGIWEVANFIAEVLQSPNVRAELEARMPEATPFFSMRNVYFKNALIVLGFFILLYLYVHVVSASLIRKPIKKSLFAPIFMGIGCMGLLMFLTIFLFAFLLHNVEEVYQRKNLPYFAAVLGGLILAMKITVARTSILKSYADTEERAKATNKFFMLSLIPMLLSPLAWIDISVILRRNLKDKGRFLAPDPSGDWQRIARDKRNKGAKGFMDEGHFKEEKLGSRQYEIWENKRTKEVKLIPWDIKKKFSECPQCHYYTLIKNRRKTIKDSTYTISGKGELADDCMNCDYYLLLDTYIIPIKTRSSSSSGGSGSGGSSGGGGGGGSFGGGSSGGGGAGGRW